MRNYRSKIAVTAVLLATMVLPSVAYAGDGTCCQATAVMAQGEAGITPRADVIYYTHKKIGGVEYHRLWNATQNRYEESVWTKCNCK